MYFFFDIKSFIFLQNAFLLKQNLMKSKNYLFKTIFIIKFVNLVFQLTTFYYKIKSKNE